MKAPGVARSRLLPPLRAWVLGMAIGAVGTWFFLWFLPYGLLIYAMLAAVLVLRGPRAAFSGALLLATGLWFTYWHFKMLAGLRRAEQRDRLVSGGRCERNAVPALTFVLVGAALSIYALLGKRSPRAGE